MSSSKRLVITSVLSTFLAIRVVAFLIPVVKAMIQPASQPVGNLGAASSGGVSEVPPTHLIVLVHGLGGTPEDLTYLKETLEGREGGDGTLVHLARCNAKNTRDGIAEGGSRLADEVREVVKSHPSLTRISLVGNSLGGLYVRYAAKLLYRGEPNDAEDSQKIMHEDGVIGTDENSADSMTPAPFGDGENASSQRKGASASETRPGGTVAGLEPSAFMTIAAPHLGVRSFTYVPLYPRLKPVASAFAGRTGSDLFMLTSSRRRSGSSEAVTSETEKSDRITRRSLLYEMSISEEYLTPLKAFRRRRAYANRRGDFMVPYGTAAFIAPGEGDGAENASAVARRRSIPVGTDGFNIIERIFGAKEGAIIGLKRIPASMPEGAGDDKFGGGGRLETGRGETVAARRGSREKAHRMSIETDMAAGLNSCGWEKVSVDFGGVFPLSHNKICAISRDRLTSALFGSGKKIMENAADFLIDNDSEDQETVV